MRSDLKREAIIKYIKEDLLLGELDLESEGITLESIEETTPLLEGGLDIDSVDTLDLLVALEKKYDLELPELTPAFIETTCRTVGELTDFVLNSISEVAGV